MTLDDLEMTLEYIFFLSMRLFQSHFLFQNCMKMKKLVQYNLDKGTVECVCERIGAKCTKITNF